MTLKSKMSLLVFLTSLSIVSVGFSSWSITAETTAEINGNIEVDNVISTEDCIYVNEIDTIKMCENGFLDEDNHIVSTGKITFHYTVNVENCKSYFAPLSSLSLTSNLALVGEEECDLINSITGYSLEIDASYNSSNSASNDFKKIYFSLNDFIDIDEELFEFTVTMFFEYEIGDSFKNNIYDVMTKNNIQFIIRNEITAV